MHMDKVPLLVALVASVVLLAKVPARLFPIIALVATAIETLRAFGILSLKIPVIGAAVLFGGLMVVGGAGSWARSTARIPVTAAVVVTLVGLLRVLAKYV